MEMHVHVVMVRSLLPLQLSLAQQAQLEVSREISQLRASSDGIHIIIHMHASSYKCDHPLLFRASFSRAPESDRERGFLARISSTIGGGAGRD